MFEIRISADSPEALVEAIAYYAKLVVAGEALPGAEHPLELAPMEQVETGEPVDVPGGGRVGTKTYRGANAALVRQRLVEHIRAGGEVTPEMHEEIQRLPKVQRLSVEAAIQERKPIALADMSPLLKTEMGEFPLLDTKGLVETFTNARDWKTNFELLLAKCEDEKTLRALASANSPVAKLLPQAIRDELDHAAQTKLAVLKGQEAPLLENVTFVDCKNAAIKVHTSRGHDVFLKALDTFGHRAINDLRPAQYADFHAAMTRLLGGGNV